jgi:hypothetical protein
MPVPHDSRFQTSGDYQRIALARGVRPGGKKARDSRPAVARLLRVGDDEKEYDGEKTDKDGILRNAGGDDCDLVAGLRRRSLAGRLHDFARGHRRPDPISKRLHGRDFLVASFSAWSPCLPL